jgi:DHA3 family macrolide efflux protein-like MFS transporter
MTRQLKLFSLGRPFLFLWAAESASLVGACLVGFSLSVWLFRTTGRAQDIALVMAANTLPFALFAPWAGAVADLIDRRQIVVVANSLAALVTAVLAALLWLDALQAWHLYLSGFATASAAAFQRPAYRALTATLVPQTALPQANGLLGFSEQGALAFTPALAIALVDRVGLPDIMLIDLATFGLATLLIMRVPRQTAPRDAASASLSSMNSGAVRHFLWVCGVFRRDRSMRLLLGYTTLQIGLCMGAGTMLTPLVLAEYGSAALSKVIAIAAVGGILGSLYLAAKRPTDQDQVQNLLWCYVVMDATLLILGLWRSLPVLAMCVFVAQWASVAATAYTMSIWLRKTPAAWHGRFLALIQLAAASMGALAALAAGSIADELTVLLSQRSASGIVARFQSVISPADGASIALVFVLMGSLGLMTALWVGVTSSLRHSEHVLPDVESSENSQAATSLRFISNF